MTRPHLFLPVELFLMPLVSLCKLLVRHLYQRGEPFWIDDNVSQAHLLGFSKTFQMLLVVGRQIGLAELHLRGQQCRIDAYIFNAHLLFVTGEGLLYLGLCRLNTVFDEVLELPQQ